MVNNPFDGFNGIRKEELDSSDLIQMLIEFEAQMESDCLSVFLKARNNSELYHMDCGGYSSCSMICKYCSISKKGKYDRGKFLRYVYGDGISPRGNRIVRK
jgi:hypothetical protein